MKESLTQSLKLAQKTFLSDKVVEFQFEKPAGFIFESGQFLQFKIPVGDSSVWRSYSIASPPSHPHLEFCIKLVDSGKASSHFQKMEPGDSVEVRGPEGMFVCKQNTETKYFIATGVGLAPIMSIIRHQMAQEKINLLFGVRNEAGLFWEDRLALLKEKNPNFNFQITLSQPSSQWKGLKGRVTEHLTIDPPGHYYICGRVEMVRDVRRLLIENGVNAKNIHFEIF